MSIRLQQLVERLLIVCTAAFGLRRLHVRHERVGAKLIAVELRDRAANQTTGLQQPSRANAGTRFDTERLL